MPHVKITELLAEVDQWTSMGDRFVHLRTHAPPKNRQALLTAVSADGINLGLTRMAEACHDTSWRQLCWTADWHVREECYAQALAGLIDAQHRLPLAAHWGGGATLSSDAQFFRAGGYPYIRPGAEFPKGGNDELRSRMLDEGDSRAKSGPLRICKMREQEILQTHFAERLRNKLHGGVVILTSRRVLRTKIIA